MVRKPNITDSINIINEIYCYRRAAELVPEDTKLEVAGRVAQDKKRLSRLYMI